MGMGAYKSAPQTKLFGGAHGSLEGVGGLKTNEAYHSKTDALLIPEMYFFENLPTPFLEMFVL